MMPRGVDVFLGLEPIDLRWSFDRLAGVVVAQMGREVRSRAIFVFLGKRREAVKALYFDGTGLCLLYKRLDRGRFRMPESRGDPGTVQLTEVELDELLSGLLTEPTRVRRRLH